MRDQTLSVLGCGWLGLPLAKRMISLGFTVKGSTTTRDKLPLLQQAGITSYLLAAGPELGGGDITSFFQSRILFLNIPFRRHLKNPDDFKNQVEAVIPYIENSSIDFVVFASSTSVYPDSLKDAREDAEFVPDNTRAKTLLNAEELLRDTPQFDTTIVRFAGLYGGERKIGRVLAGRKGLNGGNCPVNLVHLDDCVEIVAQIILKDVRGEIFNACSDGHPFRQEIYTKAAVHNGLEPPQFTDQPRTRQKVVNNTKLKKRLCYTFRHPDPMEF